MAMLVPVCMRIAMVMRVISPMRMIVRVSRVVRMGMCMAMVFMLVAVRRCFRFLFPELFARQLFFTGGDHVQLGSTDAAAVYAGYFQAGIHAQGLHCPGKELRGNSGVQQGAQKHIAADTGEAL